MTTKKVPTTWSAPHCLTKRHSRLSGGPKISASFMIGPEYALLFLALAALFGDWLIGSDATCASEWPAIAPVTAPVAARNFLRVRDELGVVFIGFEIETSNIQHPTSNIE